MKIKRNNSGAAIIWAMMTILVLAIVVGGLLTVSMVYFNRSSESVKDSQSYYNAKSGMDFVKVKFSDHDSNFYSKDGFLGSKTDETKHVVFKEDESSYEKIFDVFIYKDVVDTEHDNKQMVIYVESIGFDGDEQSSVKAKFSLEETGTGSIDDPFIDMYIFNGYITE